MNKSPLLPLLRLSNPFSLLKMKVILRVILLLSKINYYCNHFYSKLQKVFHSQTQASSKTKNSILFLFTFRNPQKRVAKIRSMLSLARRLESQKKRKKLGNLKSLMI